MRTPRPLPAAHPGSDGPGHPDAGGVAACTGPGGQSPRGASASHSGLRNGNNSLIKVRVSTGGAGDYVIGVEGQGSTGSYSVFVNEMACPSN